jgi:hypothetical protein
MSVQGSNAYVVRRGFQDRDVDTALKARKEAELAFRGQKNDEECYQYLEKDIVHYSKHPECADKDEITGLFTCYFFYNADLMSGTTTVQPQQGGMSRLWSSPYGDVNANPIMCEIHSKKGQVLWYTIKECKFLVRGQVQSGIVKPFSGKTPPVAERQRTQPSADGPYTDVEIFEHLKTLKLYSPDFRNTKWVYGGFKCVYLLENVLWTCITRTPPDGGMVSCVASNRHDIEFVRMSVPASDPYVLWNTLEDETFRDI